jgi:probable HAF family extracellular repeat protein
MVMQPKTLIVLGGVLAWSLASNTWAAPPPVFQVEQVRGLVPRALNGLGDMAGNVGNQAALYSRGNVQLLGTLGGSMSFATGLNDAGQVTGWSLTTSGERHAFLYSGGTMRDIGTLGGTSSEGAGINASGQITGTSATASGEAHAFLYSGAMMDLGNLMMPGPGQSFGNSINDLGQVAGTNRLSAIFFFDGREMQQVTNLGSSTFLGSEVRGINDRGVAAGHFCDVMDCHPFTYDGNSRTFLPLPRFHSRRSSDENTLAFAINDAGWVVGSGDETISDVFALLYIDRQPYVLEDYLDPDHRGTHLLSALDVNDSGQILAEGRGAYFLLTPMPEPQTWVMLSVGLLLLVLRAGRGHGGAGPIA